MLPARWRRSTFLTEQMNTLSSFLWNGDLNLPLMEVLPMDNDKKYKLHYVWKLLSVIDMIMFFFMIFRHRGLHYSRQSARSERHAEQQCNGHYVLHKPFIQGWGDIQLQSSTLSFILLFFFNSLIHNKQDRIFKASYSCSWCGSYCIFKLCMIILKYFIFTKMYGSITCILF